MLLVSWLNLGLSTPILKISEGKRRMHVKWKPGGKAAHMHANWMLTSFTKQNTQLRKHNWIHTWVAAGVAFIFGNKELPWEVLKSRTELKLVFFLKEVLTCGSYTLYKKHCILCESLNLSVWIPKILFNTQGLCRGLADGGRQGYSPSAHAWFTSFFK